MGSKQSTPKEQEGEDQILRRKKSTEGVQVMVSSLCQWTMLLTAGEVAGPVCLELTGQGTGTVNTVEFSSASSSFFFFKDLHHGCRRNLANE